VNWVDILVLVVGLIGLVVGWRMGLIGAAFNLIGAMVGVFAATRFSDDIAAWIAEKGAGDAIATVLAYVAIVVAVFVGAQIARRIVKTALNLVFLGWGDSLGGIAVGVVFGFVLAGAVILGLARFGEDLPDTAAAGAIVEMTGIRGAIQDAMVESSMVGNFLDVTDALPADAMGFVPGDFKAALEQLQLRIAESEQAPE
jgi:uncharacterized membrane protein required for colicin V production